MKLFEYKSVKIVKGVLLKSKNDPTIEIDKPEEFGRALNELGADGWELVQILDPRGFLGASDTSVAIFKRLI